MISILTIGNKQRPSTWLLVFVSLTALGLAARADTVALSASAGLSYVGTAGPLGPGVSGNVGDTSQTLPQASVSVTTPYVIGGGGGTASALGAFGVNQTTVTGSGWADYGIRSVTGSAASAWQDTFYAVGDTSFVLTSVLNSSLVGGCDVFAPWDCPTDMISYTLDISGLGTAIAINYSYAPPGPPTYFLNTSHQSVNVFTFTVPDGSSFNCSVTTHPNDVRSAILSFAHYR